MIAKSQSLEQVFDLSLWIQGMCLGLKGEIKGWVLVHFALWGWTFFFQSWNSLVGNSFLEVLGIGWATTWGGYCRKNPSIRECSVTFNASSSSVVLWFPVRFIVRCMAVEFSTEIDDKVCITNCCERRDFLFLCA